MAVSAVWRLVYFILPIGTEEHANAHRRDTCAPFQKSKSKRLLVLFQPPRLRQVSCPYWSDRPRFLISHPSQSSAQFLWGMGSG
ncbi:hypothetical protein EBU02_06295 [bacterium]|nr:hypothetical protein [bacterium]